MTVTDERAREDLRVLLPFLGHGVGGSHVSAMGLADGLRELGADPLFLVRPGSTVEEQVTLRGHRVESGGRPTITNPLKEAIELAPRMARLRGLSQGGPTVLHCNDLHSLRAWGLAARLLGVPVVYHHRSLDRMHGLRRALIGLAQHVFCISEATWRNVDFLPSDRRTVLLNPFPASAAAPQPGAKAEFVAELGLESDVQLVGFLANFWQRKRPFFFVAAAEALARSHPRAHFVLFGRDGDITEAEIMAKVAAAGLSGRVHFVGFRSPPERNVAAIDVLAACALDEPFGRTLVEAVCQRTPYVASESAGHAEIAARFAGGLLSPADAGPDAFAAALGEALDRPENLRVSPARLAEILIEASPRRHAEQVSKVYAALLGRGV